MRATGWLKLRTSARRDRNVPFVEQINFVPQQYRTASPIRDNTAETFLSQVVSNPFQGLTPDSPGSNGATIARRRLLLQYPHFDTSTSRPIAARTPTTPCWLVSRSDSLTD